MGINTLFDSIYVISLPTSADRREHIRAHFQDIGLTGYAFHDACDAGSAEVLDLYARGRVALYPPCFRCGKASCGKPNCNNVLIPQQVAVFASYLALWRRIAEKEECALVCEDDVVFHPWWKAALDRLADLVAQGEVDFVAARPMLIRLGWALNDDHDAAHPFEVSRTVRMANPCHAVTSAFARQLLEEFEGVHQTADVFQHLQSRVAGNNAITVLPPIAYELSWSVGALESLIHPKEIRALFLEGEGRTADAKAHRRRVARHRTNISHRKPS